ncbi:MAG: acid phosphatase type 7 [Abditibacteriota bacterium]|nr:acid phosphatase type 7 [Abditibacteriota bacterium]
MSIQDSAFLSDKMDANPSKRKWLWFALISVLLLALLAAGAWRIRGTGSPLATIKRGVSTLFGSRSDGVQVWNKRDPYLQLASPTSVTLVWQTAQPASTLFEYQLEGAEKWWTTATVDATPERQHVVKLTGLKPGTRYRYRAGSNGRKTFEGVFQTNKLPGRTFSFAAWGDSGVGGDEQKQLAAQIEKQKPDLLLHTGDLIYPRGQWKGFEPYFFDIYKKSLARVPFYGCLGNHDILTQKGRPLLENFLFPRNGPPGLMPERNYSFDYADAHFVVIDSTLKARELRERVVPWLQRGLRNSKAKWKIAMFHHPPFSSGVHGDEKSTKETLVPVFEQAKVDLVLNGHDHAYERFHPQNGVTYIVTGAGGAEHYPRRKNRAITAFFDNKKWSFTRVDVDRSTLRGRQIAADGSVIDEWRIQK